LSYDAVPLAVQVVKSMRVDLARDHHLQEQLMNLPQIWQIAVFRVIAVQKQLLEAAEGIRGLLDATGPTTSSSTSSSSSSGNADESSSIYCRAQPLQKSPTKKQQLLARIPAIVRDFHTFCASQLQQEDLPCHVTAWMVEDLPQISPLSRALQQLVQKKLMKQFGSNLEAVLNDISLRARFRQLEYSEVLLLLSSEELFAASENTVAAALGLWIQGQPTGVLEFD
jgi:hypothetical protein